MGGPPKHGTCCHPFRPNTCLTCDCVLEFRCLLWKGHKAASVLQARLLQPPVGDSASPAAQPQSQPRGLLDSLGAASSPAAAREELGQEGPRMGPGRACGGGGGALRGGRMSPGAHGGPSTWRALPARGTGSSASRQPARPPPPTDLQALLAGLELSLRHRAPDFNAHRLSQERGCWSTWEGANSAFRRLTRHPWSLGTVIGHSAPDTCPAGTPAL